jgi:hypothetical protein
MGLEALLDRQQRDEAPAAAAGVFPFAADIGDAIAREESRREIPSPAQRGYRWHAGLEIGFATARAINERREPVNANCLTTCAIFGKRPIGTQVV